MQSIALTMDNKLSENDGMIGIVSQVTNPPLRCIHAWSVDNKLFALHIVSRCSHQILDIRPMAKLSLAVAAQDFASYGFLVELLRLFVSAQIIEGDQKHDEVQAEWHLLSEQ